MDPVPTLVLLIGACLAVLLGAFLAWLAGAPARRRLEEQLAAARTDLDELRRRVDRLDRSRPEPTPDAERGLAAEFLITTLAEPTGPATAIPDDRLTGREFAEVALGESLVKAAALAHGLRRAASPENRNRIRFEVAREVKRARRQRRRDLKDARRHLRAQQLNREDRAEAGAPDAGQDAA